MRTNGRVADGWRGGTSVAQVRLSPAVLLHWEFGDGKIFFAATVRENFPPPPPLSLSLPSLRPSMAPHKHSGGKNAVKKPKIDQIQADHELFLQAFESKFNQARRSGSEAAATRGRLAGRDLALLLLLSPASRPHRGPGSHLD